MTSTSHPVSFFMSGPRPRRQVDEASLFQSDKYFLQSHYAHKCCVILLTNGMQCTATFFSSAVMHAVPHQLIVFDASTFYAVPTSHCERSGVFDSF